MIFDSVKDFVEYWAL